MLEAVVKGDRTAVEPEKGEPKPATCGCPMRDFRVERLGVALRSDCRTARTLPACGFGSESGGEKVIQALPSVVNLDRHRPNLVQPSDPASRVSADVAAQPSLVCLPIPLDPHKR